MRTLLIHTAWLGDLVLTTPLVDHLRADPDLEALALVTTPAASSLFHRDPRIDELIVYDKRGHDRGIGGYRRVIKRIRAFAPDRVLCPHRSLRSGLLTIFSGAWDRIGYSNSVFSLSFSRMVHYNPELHEVDRLLSLAGVEPNVETPPMPSLFNDPEEAGAARKRLADAKIGHPIALAPGSAWMTKRWPLECWIELLRTMLLDHEGGFVLLGGSADAELCDTIRDAFSAADAARLLNLAGVISLRESFQILRLCRAAVVNDSAPLHLAQAAGTPTLAIFGSTWPAFGFGPRGARDRVVQLTPECKPCGIHGKNQCPTGTLECLRGITSEMVADPLKEMLARK